MYIPVGGAVIVTKLTPFERVSEESEVVDVLPKDFIFIR